MGSLLFLIYINDLALDQMQDYSSMVFYLSLQTRH